MKGLKRILLMAFAVILSAFLALAAAGCIATSLYMMQEDPEEAESVETTVVAD
ncbi:MAG: hypothetical protein FWC99_05985 [Coriobacteriia bacterium]|nr:hypothetical protein [Coriobacteriia bacterium]